MPQITKELITERIKELTDIHSKLISEIDKVCGQIDENHMILGFLNREDRIQDAKDNPTSMAEVIKKIENQIDKQSKTE